MNDIIATINKIKIDQQVIEYVDFLEVEYLNYLKMLKNNKHDYVRRFLKAYAQDEMIVSNQLEGRSSLISKFIENNCSKVNPIEEINKKIKENENQLTHGDLKDLHYYLMECDNRDYLLKGQYRTDKAQIGYFKEDGTPIIQYTAPDPADVPELMGDILEYYNDEIDPDKKTDHPFLKGAIAHALVVHVQPFQDGNSRIGRILNYAKLWTDSNEKWNVNLTQPALFLSRAYSLNRGGYRGKINAIDLNIKSNESWNKWLYYNLQVMYETLSYLPDEINKSKQIYENIKTKK